MVKFRGCAFYDLFVQALKIHSGIFSNQPYAVLSAQTTYNKNFMVIHCEEKLREAQAYSAQLGDRSLQECLKKLESWERDGRTVHLHRDFAPYSFGFRLYAPDGRLIMNGGLLYHGNPDLSCAVTFNHKDLWQTHT